MPNASKKLTKKLTKAKIQLLTPAAFDIFKRIMPPIDTPLPRLYVADGRNFRKVREQALSDVSCASKEVPADDSIMEYIHGEKGSAILIRQNLLPDDSEQNFCWFLWHELGHWYAINSEKDNLYRYNGPELLDSIDSIDSIDSTGCIASSDSATLADRINGIDMANMADMADITTLHLKQEGYWFWQEFIAEAISKHVSGKYDAEVIYTNKPDHIDWNPTVWNSIVQFLMNLLDTAFSPFNSTVDDYTLAHYFANLFMRDVVIMYVKAAKNGELKVYKDGKIVYPDKPVEPTCISDIEPEEFQPAMWKLHKLLEGQMQKERFWEINENYLLELGKCIAELRDVKAQLVECWDE